MIQNLHMKRRSARYGMTLLEVLVAMLVVGLGLAVVLSMMLTANRAGEAAEHRATALREAQALADKMRVNALGAHGYVFGNPSYRDDYRINPSVATGLIQCAGPKCTRREDLMREAEGQALTRAQEDLQAWLTHLQTALPNGQAAIARHTTANQNQQRYTITIMWHQVQENHLGNNVAADDKLVLDVSL